MPDLPLHLRLIRAALRRLNIHLSRRRERLQWQAAPASAHADLSAEDAAAEACFEKHLPTVARTLSLVPRPPAGARVLELGCYMQLTPALRSYCGFTEVYGAEYGPPGARHHKTAQYGGTPFELDVDLLDAERDTFPYPDGHFELVLACEVIEHMLFDPM